MGTYKVISAYMKLEASKYIVHSVWFGQIQTIKKLKSPKDIRYIKTYS